MRNDWSLAENEELKEMTGICGWVGAEYSKFEAKLVARRMYREIPGRSDFAYSDCELGCIAGNLPAKGTIENEDAGVAAAIEGNFRWKDRSLAELGSGQGHGEALLSAYKTFGSKFLEKISGSFALAISDANEGKTLLAVDRMGIRPLCYAVGSGRRFVFASTTDAILASGFVPASISPQSIYNYLYFHVIPSPDTIYAEIKKVEPGQLVEFSNRIVSSEYYWSATCENQSVRGDAELQEELLAQLRAAVKRCDVNSKSATFLSGGLDSSTVSGMANELLQEPIQAFSIGFAQEGYDEIEYARIAASNFGLDLTEHYITPTEVADTFGQIVNSYDEPFGNSSAIPAYACAKLAKSAGNNKMLAGDGGDELFGGNERYVTQKVFEYYNRIPRSIRTSAIEPLVSWLPMDWNVLTRKGKSYIEQARVPMPERMQTYNYMNRNRSEDMFESDFLDNVNTEHPNRSMQNWYRRYEDSEQLERMMYFDWKLTLADNDLRKVNRMCELAGIDVMYPLLDDDLVSFSTTVPGNLKIRNRELRYFFKKAVAGFLPSEIIEKNKHGFGLPFGDWLISSNELRERILPNLERLKSRGVLRNRHIENLQQRHADEHAAYFGNVIWVYCVLEEWLQGRAEKWAAQDYSTL